MRSSLALWHVVMRGTGLLTLVALVACTSRPPAPIENRSGGRTQVAPSVAEVRSEYGASLSAGMPYKVARGDTLYSIAFRLGVDFRDLARWNGIPAPYTIYVGQTLQTRLKQAAVASVEPSARPEAAAKSAPSETPAPKQSVTPKLSSPQKIEPPPVAKPAAQPNSAVALGPVSDWLWPNRGKVIRSYSSSLHKGIDIAGKRGDAVRAAAAGVVVYAGTGVKGYGALLIVKHNDLYLSAYGHNDVLQVAEGDSVSAGQQIAQMGSTGTDRVKLHFEIRKQGKPINPTALLGKR